MNKIILKNKLEKYLHGTANFAEKKQIDAWLSNGIYEKLHLSENERQYLHVDIVNEIKNHMAYPIFFSKRKKKTV